MELDGYILLRNYCLDKRGDGIAMYIKSDLNSTIIQTSSGIYYEKSETLLVELNFNFHKCIICVIYQPLKINGTLRIERSEIMSML